MDVRQVTGSCQLAELGPAHAPNACLLFVTVQYTAWHPASIPHKAREGKLKALGNEVTLARVIEVL